MFLLFAIKGFKMIGEQGKTSIIVRLSRAQCIDFLVLRIVEEYSI